MASLTNEQTLESAIEKCLAGTSLEELRAGMMGGRGPDEPRISYKGGNGYFIGLPGDFNPRVAVDVYRLWDFLESTQKIELAKLQRASDWKQKFLERLENLVF